MFDIDDSGAIDHEELEELLQMAGKDLTPELARSAFRHIDANSDGNITFERIPAPEEEDEDSSEPGQQKALPPPPA